MNQKIHTLQLTLTMKLLSEVSKIDRFDASWVQIQKREGQNLKYLKSVATVRSVGASTRIEGSKMTDAEVDTLINQLKISKLENRDSQEVAGYFEALDFIAETFRDIEINEGNIKNLHTILMRYCQKDEWHRGNYKQHSNVVEASHSDGTKQTIFQTTEPGIATQEAMKKLVEWYHADNDTLPIIKAAIFVYDFLSIHPFQDGNGRLSRLLGTLLLLRLGYTWIQYVSFEHEIESRKGEYYKVLMHCQKQRPNEVVDEWAMFFLDCLSNIQQQLMSKLKTNAASSTRLSEKEKNIISIIENYPGIKSGEIAVKLNIPLPTVKRMLSILTENRVITKMGVGAGTNYVAEANKQIKEDLIFQLTSEEKKKQFLFMDENSFIEIKKINITPLFKWNNPNEWGNKLGQQGLHLKIRCIYKSGSIFQQPIIDLSSSFSLYHYNPVITLSSPIQLPPHNEEYSSNINEYPIKMEIELMAMVDKIDFDIMVIYNEHS